MKRLVCATIVCILCSIAATTWAVTAKVCIDPDRMENYVFEGQACGNYALSAGLKFRDWLAADTANTNGGGSWTVIMTRTTDVWVPLQSRIDLANNNACNRFMGIQIDAAQGTYYGGLTWVRPSADSTSCNLRDRVSSRMNSQWPTVGNTVAALASTVLQGINMPGEQCRLGYYAGPDSNYTGNDMRLEEAAIAHMYALQEHYNLTAFNPTSLPSIIVDNTSALFSASTNWQTGTSATDKYGTDYRWRSTAAISDTASWTPSISTAGWYTIYAWWGAGSNRSQSAPYVLPDLKSIYVNQQSNGGRWNPLATKYLTTGNRQTRLSCWDASGFVVIADAVKYAP